MNLTDDEKLQILNDHKKYIAQKEKEFEIQQFMMSMNTELKKDPLAVDKEIAKLESKLGIVKTP